MQEAELPHLNRFRNDTDMYIRLYDERDSYKKDIRKDGFGEDDGKVDDSNNCKGVMKDLSLPGPCAVTCCSR